MKKVMFLMLAGSLILAGCKKEGCTDSTANNYDEKAKKDDGSCTYPEVIVDPPADTEIPVVTLIKPAASATVVAGEALEISATIADNTGATSWTYSWKGEAGTVLGLTTNSLAGATSESVTASPVIGATTAAGSYTLSVTASDAAGNESTAATVSFTIDEPAPTDTEKPTITAPVKTFPGGVIKDIKRDEAPNQQGCKFNIKANDNVDLSSVVVYLKNTTKTVFLDSVVFDNLSGLEFTKDNVELRYSDANNDYANDNAKIVVKATDAAGNVMEVETSDTYTLKAQ